MSRHFIESFLCENALTPLEIRLSPLKLLQSPSFLRFFSSPCYKAYPICGIALFRIMLGMGPLL